jgi:hypothetical protein
LKAYIIILSNLINISIRWLHASSVVCGQLTTRNPRLSARNHSVILRNRRGKSNPYISIQNLHSPLYIFPGRGRSIGESMAFVGGKAVLICTAAYMVIFLSDHIPLSTDIPTISKQQLATIRDLTEPNHVQPSKDRLYSWRPFQRYQ